MPTSAAREASGTLSAGCFTGRDSCPAPGLDLIRSYVDHSHDSCCTTCSIGQDGRTDQLWTAYRA